MTSIRRLETAFERNIRHILNDFMSRIDYNNFSDSFDEGIYYFHDIAEQPITKTITTVNKAGYKDANTLIKNRMKTAAVIDKTTTLLYIVQKLTDKLQNVTENHKEEIQEKLIQHQTEQFTYDQIVDDLLGFFDYDTVAASRFARTGTNYVYNQAHLQRYKDVGFIPGVRYAAHIDARTSEICRMLNGTIWAVDDQDILTPPNHFNCYDPLTYALTDCGFKRFSSLTGNERLASLNPLTNKIEYMFPLEIVKYHYNGNMVQLKNVSYDLLVTPDHSIPYYSKWDLDQGRTVMRFKEAHALGTSDRIPLNGIWDGHTPNNIRFGGRHDFDSMMFMRFMGWFITEGNVIKNKYKNTVIISQSKTINDDHYNEIYNTGHELGLNPKDTTNGIRMKINQELWFYLSKLGKSYEKYIPYELKQLDTKHLTSFLDAAIKGDGCVHKTKEWKGHTFKPLMECTTSSKQLADDYAEIILKTGYRPSFTFPYQKGNKVEFKNGTYEIKHPAYHVRLLYSNFYSHVKKYKSTVHYNGMVYCASLPRNHTLYVRRNGKCTWSGNCRSRILPYYGTVPGERDYTKDFDKEFIKEAENTLHVFKTKYWDM